MISNLSEINRVLLGVRELTRKMPRVRRPLLRTHLDLVVIGGGNPEFDPVIDFVGQLGLVDERTTGVKLTELGGQVLQHNQRDYYELQPEQAGLLFRACYLNGELRRAVRNLLTKFEPHQTSQILVWSEIDGEPFGEPEWLAGHLEQLGVLAKQPAGFQVGPSYANLIQQFVDEGGEWTQEQMEKHLAEKRLLGEIAERYVLQYERKRLAGAGLKSEALCARQISLIRVHAGYDIESFDGRSPDLCFNRFIEVKGSGQSQVRFVWSPNEIKTAERLKEHYWIYFVGGIERQSRRVTREPVLLQNPLLHLQQSTVYAARPNGLIVEGKTSGNPLNPPLMLKK